MKCVIQRKCNCLSNHTELSNPGDNDQIQVGILWSFTYTVISSWKKCQFSFNLQLFQTNQKSVLTSDRMKFSLKKNMSTALSSSTCQLHYHSQPGVCIRSTDQPSLVHSTMEHSTVDFNFSWKGLNCGLLHACNSWSVMRELGSSSISIPVLNIPEMVVNLQTHVSLHFAVLR
jgi:hypothetical protein